MFHEEKTGGFLDEIPGKTGFIIGFVFGILVLCTAGFFFLLPLALN